MYIMLNYVPEKIGMKCVYVPATSKSPGVASCPPPLSPLCGTSLNWENFELTHETPMLKQLPGNPLVVFRGAPGSYKTESSQALLAELKLPVVAFTDYDPEGICIAATLPGFSRYLAPSDECLRALMDEINTERRYQKQVAGKLAFLESLTDAELIRVYIIVRAAGKALPQEMLIGLELPEGSCRV